MIRMEKTDLLNFVKSALKGNISSVEIVVKYRNDDIKYQYEYIFYEDCYKIVFDGIWDELATVELDEKTIEKLTYPQLVTKLTRLSDFIKREYYTLYITHRPMFNMTEFDVVPSQLI